MGIQINPSDLYYKYRRGKALRLEPPFAGPPDARYFDRDNLYQVLAMCEQVMDALGSNDGQVLERLEELLVQEMPGFISSQEQAYDFLLTVMRDILAQLDAHAGEAQ